MQVTLGLALLLLFSAASCDDGSAGGIAQLAKGIKDATTAAGAVQPVLHRETTMIHMGTEQDVGFDSIHTRSSLEKGEVPQERGPWLAAKIMATVPPDYASQLVATWSMQTEGADFLNITSLLIFSNGKGGMQIVDLRIAPTQKGTIKYGIATISADFAIPPKCTIIKTTKKSFLKSKDSIHRDCRDATITALHIKQLSEMTTAQIDYFSTILAQLKAS